MRGSYFAASATADSATITAAEAAKTLLKSDICFSYSGLILSIIPARLAEVKRTGKNAAACGSLKDSKRKFIFRLA